VVFSTDTSYLIEESDAKRWFNLSHLKGKGAESKFAVEFYDYPITSDEENLLDSMISRIPLNAIGRIILTEKSNKLLHKHVRKSMKIAVEVMSGGNHFIGFIESHLKHRRKFNFLLRKLENSKDVPKSNWQIYDHDSN
jgi:hypothetical protein